MYISYLQHDISNIQIFILNSPDEDVGVKVDDVDLVSPEEGAYQSSLGDLHLRQLKVPRTEPRLVEDGKGSRLFLSPKLL